MDAGLDDDLQKTIGTLVVNLMRTYGSADAEQKAAVDWLLPELRAAPRTNVEILAASATCYLADLLEAAQLNATLLEAAKSYRKLAIDAHETAKRLLRINEQQPRTIRAAMARRAANLRLARDPKHAVMDAIKAEFSAWQSHKVRYRNDADFAKKMHAKYATTIRNEGSIKNACARWHKENKSSC